MQQTKKQSTKPEFCVYYPYTIFEQGLCEFVIVNATNQPIYEQIAAQIKGMVICGELRIITTKRATEDLARVRSIFDDKSEIL